jgi:tetratricopeptide (TPR) repeat protein
VTRAHRGRRVLWRALGIAACAPLLGAWCMDQPDRRSILALAEAGRLDDAEASARTAGPAFATTLGDVLVLRGRLASADSAYDAAIAQRAPFTRLAEIGRAEIDARRGALAEALARAERVTAAYERDGRSWQPEEHMAAGRAFVLLGRRDARLARQALAAFDAAWNADNTLLEARVRAADLLLDKYNAADARGSYEDVLAVSAEHPAATLGLARVQEFDGRGEAMTTVRKALAGNPALTPAHVMLARLHLEAEAYDSARVAADRALAVDSTAIEAWALRAAVAWFTGDSTVFTASRAAAEALHPRPSEFYATLAESAVRHRRYADGVRFATTAASLDSTSVRALGVLGTNQLRMGDMDAGRATLERAFAIDPYNVWHKNTLDLLDQMNGFTTIARDRFQLVVSPEDAALMELYLLPLLEEAFDSLAPRYAWRPERPVRFEIFRRHADFSVRSVGLTGLGALGVSFGDVLAMDAPSAREPGSFNWGSTAWHELAHTFTLGASANHVPRWLSEGLSVLEERRARGSWGATATPDFLAAYKAGQLRPVSTLNDGFVRPRYPAEVQYSYYLASLVSEMLEAEFGAAVFPALLTAYRSGLDSPAAFARATRLPIDSIDARFQRYMQQRFAAPLAAIEAGEGPGDVRGPFVDAMREGAGHLEAKRTDAARAAFEKAQALLPGIEPVNGASWQLARLALERADTTAALAQLARITRVHETALAPNLLEADLHEARGDDSALVAALERVIWSSPYDAAVHVRLAEAATRLGRHAVAVRERRAVLATGPADPLEARYQLARALATAGDVAAARREVLGMLETAPGFEKAQALLLELRRPPGGAQ